MHQVVSRFGLSGQFTELCGGPGQITLDHVSQTKTPAALTRPEPVTHRICEVSAFFSGPAHRDRITGDKCRIRLPAKDLTQSPRVANFSGKPDRFGEVWPRHLDVVT